MSRDDIKNELRYNQEKLRLANTSGDTDLKKKVQTQLQILNLKMEIETLQERIKQLQSEWLLGCSNPTFHP
jgi:phage host-nuclease inhibitor protein Gam